MKHLIYFLLFSTAVFSQNYQYALEEAKVKLPEMPSGLVASQITDTSADLAWISPVGRLSISSYGIYNSNSLLANSPGLGTSYKLIGLIPDTAYTLTVRAIDDQGKISADSNSQTFRTKKSAVETILSPPNAVTFSQIAENSAVITWSAPTANTLITEYGVFSENILLGKSVAPNLSFSLVGLTPETTYTISVRSIDKTGKMSIDSELKTFTTKKLVTQPAIIPVSELLASQVTENSVVLNWIAPSDNSSITDYGIYHNNILIAKSVGTGTTYKVIGLTPETAYSLTVRAIDKSGSISSDSNVQTFTTSKVSAPTSLIASEITENSVVLTWTASAANSSITDYGIYNKNVLLVKSVGTSTTHKVTGLTPETAYSLTVRAIDKSGSISSDSNVQTLTTTKVSAPTSLIATEITENSVVLTWAAPIVNSSITDYGIYNKNVLLVKSVGTSTTYKVTGLTPETAYSLTVRAIDKSGSISVDSNVQAFTTSKVSAPTSLIASQITENSVVLTWTAPTANSSITDYGIYSKNVLLVKSVGKSTTYKVTGLTQETAYSLTVRAIDKSGSTSVDSNVQTFTTSKVSAPTSLIASQITENSVVLTWTAPAANSSITDYGIYSKNVLLVKSVGTGTTYKVTGLTPETAYSLTVRSIDKSGSISVDSNVQTFTTSKTVVAAGVNNQLEEIEYFKAYLLPIAQKATLQQALDKYGSVRLEKGDYRGVNIVMHSNQRLYGHPTLTAMSNITIAAGSSNVHLEDLIPSDSKIILEAGAAISNITFKSIKWATLVGKNIKLENSTFINFQGPIQLDCSQSGYFRNNKIIRHQCGTVSNLLVMKGNSTTPSYGNVHLWTNFLTPHGDATDIDGLQSATFVGLDAEAWNYQGLGTGKAMLSAHNMGNVKLADFGGGNGSSTIRTPALDIDADNLFVLNKGIGGYLDDIIAPRTNLTSFMNRGYPYTRSAGTATGFSIEGSSKYDNIVKYNGVVQTSKVLNSTTADNIKTSLLGTQYTPWARPTWNNIPDVLGSTWSTDRVGKPDSRAYIQNLIDTNKIAELPEGIFYISSTLLMPMDRNHGIIGKGTGKTVICGLTDDFPLISLGAGYDANFALAYLTLQGGSTGIYASMDYGILNMAYQNMKFVVFRDQVNGIHLNKSGGFDNNFLENLAFVNCKKAFFQEPTPGNSGEQNSAYVDKTMFYKSQFINCNIAMSMLATRANNLDSWVDCKFDGGDTAIISSISYPVVANCDFSNYTGKNVINGPISLYNSNFYNNSNTSGTLSGITIVADGCNFLDAAPLLSPVQFSTPIVVIANSIVNGSALVTIPDYSYYNVTTTYVNCRLLSNPTISKLLVHIKESGTPTVIIDETPNPYPQFLVTQ